MSLTSGPATCATCPHCGHALTEGAVQGHSLVEPAVALDVQYADLSCSAYGESFRVSGAVLSQCPQTEYE